MATQEIIVLDVNQTLAGGIISAHLRFYNSALRDYGFHMTEEEIAEAEVKYRTTFEVPQIKAFRESSRTNEVAFQDARTLVRSSPEVNGSFPIVPGSVDGVRQLVDDPSRGDEVYYYTVRPSNLTDVTKKWLEEKDFPHSESERIVLCNDAEDKLRRIITDQILSRPGEEIPVVLIDDQLEGLVDAAKRLEADDSMREAMRHLVIVGFGITKSDIEMKYSSRSSLEIEGTPSPETSFKILALPSWSQENVTQLRAEINGLQRSST